jgi:kynureninase
MHPPDALLRFRPEFPILERKTYLVSHSLGAMPRAVEKRMHDYVSIWASEGVGAWERDWWDLPIRTGNEIAPLLGASDGEVAMMPNVSLAQATVLSSIPFSAARDKIVMTALDFPSVRYVYDSLAPRFGARIEVVPSDDGISIAEQRIIDAIDDRTALVAISHVLFRSAYIMDVAAICAKAKQVGARVSLDSFHAVGTLPLDVHGMGVDFMSGGVLKWLCGGPGGCFLYVSAAARAQLKPAITGWQAHAKPFEFAGEMDYAEGIWGWLSGTPSIPALYAASEGPKILRQAGIKEIRAKSLRQTARLIEMADQRGFRVNSARDGARRGGTVSIEPPNAIDVYRHLLSRDVMVDYRPGAGLRIAPHFYTSDEELDRAMDEIDAAVAEATAPSHAGREPATT